MMSLYPDTDCRPPLSVGPCGHDPSPGPALVAQHRLNLVEGVGDPARELFAAPILLQEVKPEGSVLSRLVNVGDSAKEGTEDDLGVVLEEVDLHCAVCEVHHHCPARPEPGLECRDTGQLVLLPDLGVN